MKTRIPKNFNKVLKIFQTIQTVFPDVIIAGGAIRDMMMDKPIKDYDFFIQNPFFSKPIQKSSSREDIFSKVDNIYTDPAYWRELLELGNLNLINRVFFGGSAPINDKVTTVIHVEKDDIRFDIIMTTHSPKEHVRRFFDIGLCKAYFDGKKFRFMTDFVRDKEHKTLTFVGEQMDIHEIRHCLVGHMARIQQKYPNFKIAYASHLQNLVVDLPSKK